MPFHKAITRILRIHNVWRMGARAIPLLGLLASSDAGAEEKKKPAMSDHYNGKIFFNPGLPADSLPQFRDALRLMREPREKWPNWVENKATPKLSEKWRSGDISLTFINHATFLIQINGCNILTDPVWSERASPFRWVGPKRVRHPGIALENLPRIDLILISHNHYDHLDVASLRQLNQRFAPKVFAPLGNRALLESAGCREIIEMDWWETARLPNGVSVAFAPAQHQANRGFFDRGKSLWGSFMVTAGRRRIYFGGDSGYAGHYGEIRRRLGAPDLALLGIGSYEPRWFMRSIHKNPEEAVAAHRDLQARQSVGMHFGTFQLSGEAIDQPQRDLKAALAAARVPSSDFITLDEGETKVFVRK